MSSDSCNPFDGCNIRDRLYALWRAQITRVLNDHYSRGLSIEDTEPFLDPTDEFDKGVTVLEYCYKAWSYLDDERTDERTDETEGDDLDDGSQGS